MVFFVNTFPLHPNFFNFFFIVLNLIPYAGTDRCKTPDDIHNCCHLQNFPLETRDSADSDDNEPSNREGPCSKTLFSFAPLTLNSVLRHIKAISSVSIEVLLTRSRGSLSYLSFSKEGDSLEMDRIHRRKLKENSVHETVRHMFQSDGSYIDDLAIDSSWPLCMYELRGKCNNDECPWQHVKDYSFANGRQYQRGLSNYSGTIILDVPLIGWHTFCSLFTFISCRFLQWTISFFQ